MTRFRRRRLPLILGGVALILLLLALLLPRLLPAGRIRQIVADRIAAATGGEVALGDAHLTLLPRLRLEVDDASLRGSGADLARATGSPTPLVRYEAAAERLQVDLALWPLLSRRIEIGTIRLVAPSVELVTAAPSPAAAGGGDADAGGVAGGGAGGAGWEFALAGVEIRDGRLHWRQEGSGREVTVAGWRQDVEVKEAPELFRRLALFQAGAGVGRVAAPPPGVEPGAAEAEGPPAGTPVLELSAALGRVAWSGFGERGGEVGDLELRGSVWLPPAGDALSIQLVRAGWRSLELAADLRLDGGPRQGRLRGSWRLLPLSLPALLADTRDLLPPPPGEAGRWLAGDPVRAGELRAEGRLDLPWPPPPDLGPAGLADLIGARGRLQGAEVALPADGGWLEASADFALAGGRLEVTDLRLAQAEGLLQAEGSLGLPLPGGAGPLRADLEAQGDLGGLSALAARLAGPAAVPVSVGGQVKVRLRADLAGPLPTGGPDALKEMLAAGRLDGVSLDGAVTDLGLTLPVSPEPFRCERLTFGGPLDDLRFACREVTHPALRGAAQGRVLSLLPPSLTVEATLARLDLDALAAAGRGADEARGPAGAGDEGPIGWLVPAARAAAPGGAAGTPAPPRRPPGEAIPADLTVAFTARADEVVLQKALYRDVETEGRLVERVLTLEPLTARRETGTIGGRAVVDWASDPEGRLDFALKAEQVPAAALLAPYLPALAGLWQGTVSADAQGGLDLVEGADPRQLLRTLSLAGDAVSSDGSLDARGLLAGVAPYLGQRQDLLLVRFQRFVQRFRIEDGRYVVEGMRIEGPDTDWWGDGWVGLDGGIDLLLRVKLPADFKPDLGNLSALAEALRGEDGRIELAMRLTGEARHPKVQLELGAAKRKAEQEIKSGVERLLDKIKGK